MMRPIVAVVALAVGASAVARGDPPVASAAGAPPINVVVGDNRAPMDSYGVSYNVAAAPLPAGHLDAVPVEDELGALQAYIPHFRYVVRRLPGVAADGARLPAMETTDLTLGEFVNYVNANCPQVRIEPDKSVSDSDPLYVVTLSPPPPTTRPGGAAPYVVRAVSIRAAVQVQQRVRDETPDAALADVLSLVQVLVDTSPDGGAVKLKVHEPTGMLIVDAPAPVADAVAAAVETMSKLTPEQARLMSLDQTKLASVDSLNAALARAQAQVADRDRELARWRDWANRQHELELNLRSRVAATQAATQPAGH